MCGIIGYQGPQNIKDILLTGLKALEYRGYDSAGVAIFHQQKIKQVHAEGSLENLQKEIDGMKFNGHLGIGHTRWATHGIPSKQNAHPHYAGGFSIVHNGIIENYLQLKKQVLASGAKILSETDSEIIAHLLSIAFDRTGDLLQAITETLPSLKGSYAVLAINEKQPDTWIAFKSGPPLVLGVNQSEIFIASDIQPLISHTDQIIYLQDNEFVKIQNTNYQIFDQKGQLIQKTPITLSDQTETIDKKGYPHFMLKEIFEQSACIQKITSHFLKTSTQTVQLASLNHILKDKKYIVIVACGSSYYAGLVGKYLIERLSDVSVKVEIASEFRYQTLTSQAHTLFLFISQSGETADTLAALSLTKQKEKPTLAICNMPHSTIARQADHCIDMSAGIEVSVASTKTFTNTIAILNILALGLQKLNPHDHSDKHFLQIEKDVYQAFSRLPSQIEQIFYQCHHFKKIADQIKNLQNILYIGRGTSLSIALEGALKLKELAYIHAEGCAAGEMKHGPIALVDKNTKVIALISKDNQLYHKTKNNLKEIQARGGKIIQITTKDDQLKEDQNALFDDNIYPILPKAHFSTYPILEAIAVQLIAYYVASSLGHNVDRPRNLAKSVTVE